VLKNPIAILYEDQEYIVFNKPAGLLVIPSPREETDTLVERVNEQLKSSVRLYPCHRLDRETSGVILFAKGKHNQQLMMEAFKRRQVKKKYVAFIHGALAQKSGEIKSIIYNPHDQHFRRHPPGRLAISRYKVLEIKKHFSIVEVEPITGRTNQIRIQFKEIGHPLVGERKYAFARDYFLKFRRVALHAQALECTQPVTREKIKIFCDLPKDMQEFLEKGA